MATYELRNVPQDVWDRFKAQCLANGETVHGGIIRLMAHTTALSDDADTAFARALSMNMSWLQANWFVQGGHAEFGPLPHDPENADDFVSMVLALVRGARRYGWKAGEPEVVEQHLRVVDSLEWAVRGIEVHLDERGTFIIESYPHTCTEAFEDGECAACSVRDCPHQEPLHYHHDGCPACSERQVWE